MHDERHALVRQLRLLAEVRGDQLYAPIGIRDADSDRLANANADAHPHPDHYAEADRVAHRYT
jgi:hypothetical protein